MSTIITILKKKNPTCCVSIKGNKPVYKLVFEPKVFLSQMKAPHFHPKCGMQESKD